MKKIGVADWAWVTLSDLNRFAFAKTDQKIIEALLENNNHSRANSNVIKD